jgi:hypothetical protein
MAYSSSNTKLSINRWGELMGINPYVLNGVQVGSCMDAKVPYDCEQVWTQYRWQSAANATREQLGLAIKSATDDIEWKLGFPIAPTYISNEEVILRKDEAIALANTRTILLYLDYKRVISAGRQPVDTIGVDIITDYDYSGDGVNDGIMMSFFVGDSDSMDEPLASDIHSTWEVLMIPKGSFGVHTVPDFVMPRAPYADILKVVPDILNQNYVQYNVRFYYPYEDVMDFELIAQRPGHDGYIPPDICVDDVHEDFVLRSKLPTDETQDDPFVRIFCREDSSCAENCAEQILPGILEVIDSESGLVAITMAQPVFEEVAPDQDVFVGFECATDVVNCLPYKVEVDYRAGAIVTNGEVFMEQEIAKMAASRLPMSVCECGNYGIANNYRDDYALYDKSAPRRTTARLLDNPFGTRRGEVEAWMAIQKHIGDVQYAGLI